MLGGFLMCRDAIGAVSLVTVGSAMAAATSLGYRLSIPVLGASISRKKREKPK